MKRLVKNVGASVQSGDEAHVFLFALILFFGCVGGFVASGTARELELLPQVLHNALTSFSGGPWTGVFISSFKYIIAISLFSFSVYGAAVIPLLIFAKGFFLSLFVSVFTYVFSYGGLLATVSCFLVPEFFSICAILLVSQPALNVSGSMISTAFSPALVQLPAFSAEKLRCYAVGYLMTSACFLWNLILNPPIIKAITERIGL